MTSNEKAAAETVRPAVTPLRGYVIAGLLNAAAIIANPLFEGTYYVLPLLIFQVVVCLPATLVVVVPRRRRVWKWPLALVVVLLFIGGMLLNIRTVSGYTD